MPKFAIDEMLLPETEDLKFQIMKLVDTSWNNHIDLKAIDEWLTNFSGEALEDIVLEQNLALWMLFNFVYYNEDEVKHLCKLMLKKYIHSIIQSSQTDTDMAQISKLVNETQFVNLGKESESGAYILYMFRQENQLPLSIFKNTYDLNTANNIVIIDDVSLSGNQAISRIEDIRFDGTFLRQVDLEPNFVEYLMDNSLDHFNKINLRVSTTLKILIT